MRKVNEKNNLPEKGSYKCNGNTVSNYLKGIDGKFREATIHPLSGLYLHPMIIEGE
jgi:hypothetical protein